VGKHTYHCRGCGQSLPSLSRCLFHPVCLKADKRRRVQETRQRERDKFERWLNRQKCPRCGAGLGSDEPISPLPSVRPTCEVSRGVTAAHGDPKAGKCAGKPPGADLGPNKGECVAERKA
jgi:hypothetical protein